ncbi:MAG: energy transducer TonB [Flavobacteriaceae bacterium]
MKLFDTPHKQKSAGLTFIVALLLLLLFFLLGLTYYDPPMQYGMEVNFGTSSQGLAEEQTQVADSSPQNNPITPPIDEQEISPPAEAAVLDTTVEEIITEKESPITVPKEVSEKPASKAVPQETKAVPEPPKISDATKNMVSNLLSNKETKAEELQGEGNDNVFGDKGKVEGNPYASTYYSTAGLGGLGKGYGLNGRNLLSSGKVVQDCNQEGIVVVRITVNNQGQVIAAEPGVRGSTNIHPCLLKPAQETALLHQWYPDNQAPAEQIGFVVIQFKLGE